MRQDEVTSRWPASRKHSYSKNMSVSELSASTQDYLKAIWGLSEWSTKPVTPSLIAARTGLKLSSVSDAVRRLTEQGLAAHAPYGSVELTPEGRRYALAMVRRHRLIETFLVEVLGYAWDQVHQEAERLEHAVSDFMVERIDAYLNFPRRDPHGDPIPTDDGSIVTVDAQPLTTVESPGPLVVERISDADPALLQFFQRCGITVGSTLTDVHSVPFSETINVQVEGADEAVPLGRAATDSLYVSRPS